MEILFYVAIIGVSVYSGFRCYRSAEKKRDYLERQAQRQELLAKLREIRNKRKRYSTKKD